MAISTTPIPRTRHSVRPRRAMSRKTELAAAVLISTYERPEHLQRSLLSVSLQQGVAGKFEIVVTDDGSQDETADLVADFAKSVDFPVQLTTHKHAGFQLARCRNEGVLASSAPYLLFVDGDLILPPDFVAQHIKHRLPGIAMAGESCYLPEDTSTLVDEQAIQDARFMQWIPASEQKRIASKRFNARIYKFLRAKALPRFKGGNIGIWREDYERVNGYDQNFVGWGAEEDDLQQRLSKQGVRFRSSLNWTTNCHMWHTPSPSFAPKLTGNSTNRSYLRQPGRLSICRKGLRMRSLEELAIQANGNTNSPTAQQLLRGRFQSASKPAEVELLFAERGSRFTAKAECNVLIVDNSAHVTKKLLRQAHILVADKPIQGTEELRQYPRHQFEEALESIV